MPHSRTDLPEHFLPLPEQARPPQDPAEGYRLQRAGDAGYVVISGFVQSSFVVTSDGVVVVDAPPALAEKIPVAIKRVTDKPVTHFIYTHSHYDHVGSATHFPNAERIAHAETARILAIHADPERPLPTRTFDGDQMSLVVGGKSKQELAKKEGGSADHTSHEALYLHDPDFNGIELFSHYGPLYRRWRMKSRKHRPSWLCPVGRPLTLN